MIQFKFAELIKKLSDQSKPNYTANFIRLAIRASQGRRLSKSLNMQRQPLPDVNLQMRTEFVYKFMKDNAMCLITLTSTDPDKKTYHEVNVILLNILLSIYLNRI